MNQSEYVGAVKAVHLCLAVLGQHDLQKVLANIGTAESIGPILDPSLWIQKGGAMAEDKEAVEAAMPLWRLARKLKGPEAEGAS